MRTAEVFNLDVFRKAKAEKVAPEPTPEMAANVDGMSQRQINRQIADANPSVLQLAKLLTVARYKNEDARKFPGFGLEDEFKPMDAFVAQAIALNGDPGLVEYMTELLKRD